MIRQYIRNLRLLITNWLHAVHARPNENPIIVLGNQKSGTSAIAALLGKTAAVDVRVDFFHLVPGVVEDGLHSGRASFSGFVDRYPHFFEQEIIKEPGLTFLYEDIKSRFPESKVVFILRDPRDNIRSILNRLSVPGDKEEVLADDYSGMPNDIWRSIVGGKSLGLEEGNYVERLSLRWLKALKIYEEHSQDMILVRYEDFKKNKTSEIKRLALELGLDPKIEIDSDADKPFQPGGDNSSSWDDFFGRSNLEKINNIVFPQASSYGYFHRCMEDK